MRWLARVRTLWSWIPLGWKVAVLMGVSAVLGVLERLPYQAIFVLALATVGFGLIVVLMVDEALAHFRRPLEDNQTRLAIANRLGEYGAEGLALIKPVSDIKPRPVIDAWRIRVEGYIDDTLGQGYRYRFTSGAGNEPTVPPDVPANRRADWIHVQARHITLKKFVEELSTPIKS